MEGAPHKIIWNERKSGSVTGVVDVISFDSNEVLLETGMGIVTIRGKELQVKRLSVEKGEVDIDGRLETLVYSDTREQKGKRFLGRLMK